MVLLSNDFPQIISINCLSLYLFPLLYFILFWHVEINFASQCSGLSFSFFFLLIKCLEASLDLPVSHIFYCLRGLCDVLDLG